MSPLRLLALAAALALAAPAALAQPAPATAAFTDSTVAGLAPTKRVAISTVVVEYQISVAALKEAGTTLFSNRTSVSSLLSVSGLDLDLEDAIAAKAYETLKAQLSAAGYEVVPEAEVKASPAYAQIEKLMGMPANTKFANAMGDAMFTVAPGLTNYLPYIGEAGVFAQPKSYIGFTSAFGGKSATSGGPSMMSQSNGWKLPGLEVQLAKELNANVVKANYMVSLGSVTATKKREINSDVETYRDSFWSYGGSGNASVGVGLMADQTRIAFRSPTGNNKWQKVSMLKVAPPKDGDVVVRLANSLEGGGSFFDVQSSKKERGVLMGGADMQFVFDGRITDRTGYRQKLNAMIEEANIAMVAAVKR